jgi:hypothetical protein
MEHCFNDMCEMGYDSRLGPGLTSIFSPLATSITPTSVDYSNVQSEKIVAQYINVTAISLLPSSNVDIVAEQSLYSLYFL